MEKMKFETVDGTRRNVDKIAEMFPQVVTEVLGDDGKLKRAVKWDVLKELLSGDYVEGGECYEFTWPGKRAAIAEAAKPIRKTLRPCKEESKNWDTTENLYIEGDNLEALKLLQESYLGKVKMIYIDPPYNTGNDFVYRDEFTKDKKTSEDELGLFDEETDNRTMSGELFHNTESNGRFHSDWCSMMYSRLQVASNFLSEDGLIFISIDDNEITNLKHICDEIFSSCNFINILSLKMKSIAGASGGGEDHRLKKNCEYVLIYAKQNSSLSPLAGVYDYIDIGTVIEEYKRDGKSWHYSSVLCDAGEKIYLGSTQDGDGNEIRIFSRPNAIIKSVNQIALEQNIEEKEVFYRYGENIFEAKDAQSSIRTRIINFKNKNLVKEDILSIEYVPKTGKNKGHIYEQFYKGEKCRLFAWLRDITENIDGVLYKKTQQGTFWDFTSYMNNLSKEGDITFANGKKPVDLIKRMLLMLQDKTLIALDFFSGSATTAHAVMQLNAEDGGNRKFIMVQLPEVCADDSEAAKAGYKNICEIGKERIRRAGDKILAECAARTNGGGNGDGSGECGGIPDLDIGFRVFKVADSNMKDVYYSASDYSQDMLDSLVSNIKEDRTDLDLLYGCLLKWGVELSLPHTSETIDNVTVHSVNNGDLIACFDANIPESAIRTIAKRQPLRAVFRDSSFASAPQKINVEEIFKLLSPTTTVKVI